MPPNGWSESDYEAISRKKGLDLQYCNHGGTSPWLSSPRPVTVSLGYRNWVEQRILNLQTSVSKGKQNVPCFGGKRVRCHLRCVSQHIKCQDRATRPERGNNHQTSEAAARKLAHATLQNRKQTSETRACKLARATQQNINQPSETTACKLARATQQNINQTSEAAAPVSACHTAK